MQEIVNKKDGIERLSFAQSYLNDVRRSVKDIEGLFFKIGYYFNFITEKGYYIDLGYVDIFELAEKEFGFKTTTVKNLMEVNRVYCCNKIDPITRKERNYTDRIDPHFQDFSQTQLVEMLPLYSSERANVPASMTIQEIRDYKKSLKSRRFGSYEDAINNPQNAVIRYREVIEKEKILNSTGACPGQLLIPGVEKSQSTDQPEEVKFVSSGVALKAGVAISFEDDTEESEYYEEYESQSTDCSEEPAEEVEKIIQPLFPARHILKNDKERLEFINDESNFDRLVLKNEELGIEVRSLKFHNGAILYQTIYNEYYEWSKKMVRIRTLHLVDVNDARPDSCSASYGLKTYTLKGTAPTYVVKYMAMYKNEI